MTYPTKVLASPAFQEKFGALFDGVRISFPHVFTASFHNVRMLVLTACMIIGSDFPLLQSISYLVSSIIGLCWDLILSPYETTVLKLEAIGAGIFKILCSTGYIVLSVPNISSGTANFFYYSVYYLLIGSIVFELGVAIADQVITLYHTILEKCTSHKREAVYDASIDTSNKTIQKAFD